MRIGYTLPQKLRASSPRGLIGWRGLYTAAARFKSKGLGFRSKELRFVQTNLLLKGRVEAHAYQCYDGAMNSTAIEQSALRLPKPDRAHLVHLLLDSLDDPSDADIQALWLNAAKRRADEIDNGKVKLVSGEDLERQVQALFK